MPRSLFVADLTNIGVRFSVGFQLPPAKAAEMACNYLARTAATLGCEYAACAVDTDAPTWRRARDPEYKGDRTHDTAPYSAAARLVARRRGWTVFELPGFEADDGVATIVERAVPYFDVFVCSCDSDLLALCRESTDLHGAVVQVWPMNGGTWELRTAAWVRAAYALREPALLPDFKAIAGERGDNVPGIGGRTPKGKVSEQPALARRLLAAFGTLDDVIAAGEGNASKEARAAFLARERLQHARTLVTLRTDAPVPALRPSALRLRAAA